MPLLQLTENTIVNNVLIRQATHDGFFDQPNVVVKGLGSGVSKTNEPIKTTQWRPHLEGFTIFNNIELVNPAEILMRDVWVHHGTGIGIDVRLHLDAPWERMRWPDRGDERQSPRCTLSNFYDVHVTDNYRVDANQHGWRFYQPDFSAPASEREGVDAHRFFNNVNFHGGHTAVGGIGMIIYNVNHINSFGHYIDSSERGGLRLGGFTDNVVWHAGFVEGKTILTSEGIKSKAQAVKGTRAHTFKYINDRWN